MWRLLLSPNLAWPSLLPIMSENPSKFFVLLNILGWTCLLNVLDNRLIHTTLKKKSKIFILFSPGVVTSPTLCMPSTCPVLPACTRRWSVWVAVTAMPLHLHTCTFFWKHIWFWPLLSTMSCLRSKRLMMICAPSFKTPQHCLGTTMLSKSVDYLWGMESWCIVYFFVVEYWGKTIHYFLMWPMKKIQLSWHGEGVRQSQNGSRPLSTTRCPASPLMQ